MTEVATRTCPRSSCRRPRRVPTIDLTPKNPATSRARKMRVPNQNPIVAGGSQACMDGMYDQREVGDARAANSGGMGVQRVETTVAKEIQNEERRWREPSIRGSTTSMCVPRSVGGQPGGVNQPSENHPRACRTTAGSLRSTWQSRTTPLWSLRETEREKTARTSTPAYLHTHIHTHTHTYTHTHTVSTTTHDPRPTTRHPPSLNSHSLLLQTRPARIANLRGASARCPVTIHQILVNSQ